ncbi:MAG TPA: SH3 domain-containing protein [Chakrabartia sp.]|nr:SH3 domain-containing protein [Chakrabartia sp.]
MSAGLVCAAGLAMALVATPATAQRKPPYWASIAAQANEARMRTGPGKQFPTSWIFQRPRLPLKVIGVYREWRKVEDPSGTQGWMLSRLLSPQRTGLIKGGVAAMHASTDANAKIVFRASPGVVGKLSECARGWCLFDVNGQMGYVETSSIFGVDAEESRR